ncbi:MAG: hypothetical protein FJ218_03345 [Ignavibacteria bacterium]|nr:hypothetical protein [Ignavibacteria bacterium]
MNHTLTIHIPDNIYQIITQEALQTGKSLEEVLLQSVNSLRKTPRNPFFADENFYEGDVPSDLSLHHDEYLYGDKQ